MTKLDKAGGPLILVVEDEILIRMVMADDLRLAGFQVLEAINGEEALALFTANPHICLILSDIRVPGSIDGVQFATLVKQQRPDLPVVLVSAHLPDGRESVADHFFRKPYDQKAVINLVRDLSSADHLPDHNRDAL
ncbi:putative response regulator [Caenibius tardaugens NBRC 16725]|uniref:Putative response regulator n=1 Tax=Caenibius tardaugens NBRC 16725 TaxID=1219035 RepID=U2Y5X8_9SPHN|nr:response regulator [Caenibius tardaugens]AZI34994.1 response regulator [Caenibius tardaugens NBRC 16725]GAD48546.1 putative response regulator [Caenibius tardaugens NBRC 16725]